MKKKRRQFVARMYSVGEMRNDPTVQGLAQKVRDSLDWKRIDGLFHERFEQWWSEFEPFERKRMKRGQSAKWLKEWDVDLETVITLAQGGFEYDLEILFHDKLDATINGLAEWMVRSHVVLEVEPIKRVVEQTDNIQGFLKGTFSLPTHMLALISSEKDLKQEIARLIQTAKKTPRLRLPPSQQEALLDKICFEVEDFILQGLGTQEQAYTSLSAKSQNIFGYKMTSKQIEGKYNRWKRNPKRSKYEK
jgi:hypothetical protein